jgi:hypothetical protein
MASLVDDLDATIACPECGRVCPTRMHSCPGCLALLRPGEVDLTDDVTRMLSRGMRMHRPAGREPFEGGVGCSVLRLHPQGPLVVCGADGLIEANLAGRGIAARAPLTCSTDGTILFRLEVYAAVPDAVVAIGGDGAALATFLRTGGMLTQALDVRDETSAPVARLAGARASGGYVLTETGGDAVATIDRTEVEDDLWLDDQWSLSPAAAVLPLKRLGLVALVVAAKVLLGRPEPVRVREEPSRDPDDPDDAFGALGRSIIQGFLD